MIPIPKETLLKLLDAQQDVKTFQIGPFRLGDDKSAIPHDEINDIYVINPNVKDWVNQNSNHTIKERLAMLADLNGWVHLAGGLSIMVSKSKIQRIRLHKLYIESLSGFTREDVEDKLGMAEEYWADVMIWGMDVNQEAEISAYQKGMLCFYFHHDTLKIKEVSLGPLDWNMYERRSRPEERGKGYRA